MNAAPGENDARPPTPPAMSTFMTLAVSFTFTLVALSVDIGTGDSHAYDVIQAHYYRKAVRPAMMIQFTQLLLAAAGVFHYGQAVVNAVIGSSGMRRKAADLLAAALYFAHYALSIFVIGPLEKKVGATLGGPKPVSEDVRWLMNWHFLSLGMYGFLFFLGTVAYTASLEDDRLAQLAQGRTQNDGSTVVEAAAAAAARPKTD